MKVNFNHFESFSTIDYPEKVCCVVFFNECNFRCPNCHNKQTWTDKNYIDVNLIKNKILESKPLINTVIFSGGEPTLQIRPLLELCKFSKDNGFAVGIETNGSNSISIALLKPYVDLVIISLYSRAISLEVYKILKFNIPIQIRIVNFDQSKTDEIIKSLPVNMNIKILEVNKKVKKVKQW